MRLRGCWWVLALVFALSVGVAAVLAAPQTTVVLSNGRSYTGAVSLNGSSVVVQTSRGQLRFPITQVAVIEYVEGQPSDQELQDISSSGSWTPGFLRSGRPVVLALRDGSVIQGQLGGISSDGTRITVVTSNGRDNYLSDDVARLYLNPSSAQRLYTSNGILGGGQAGAVGTSGRMNEAMVNVDPKTTWTPTGMMVRQGEQLRFDARGQIQYALGGNSPATPAGAPIGADQERTYPVPSAGVGALIARVGNSAPFLIGANTGPIAMPASGELFLGVNDNYRDDNSGSYFVRVQR